MVLVEYELGKAHTPNPMDGIAAIVKSHCSAADLDFSLLFGAVDGKVLGRWGGL